MSITGQFDKCAHVVFDVDDVEKLDEVSEIILNSGVHVMLLTKQRKLLAFLGGDTEIIVPEIHTGDFSTSVLDIVGLVEDDDTVLQIDLHLYIDYELNFTPGHDSW